MQGNSLKLRSLAPAFNRLLDQFMTSLCPLCEQPSANSHLCDVCAGWLQPLPDPCPGCAAPNTLSTTCGRCQQRPPPWQTSTVAWELSGATRFLIHRMKYHRDLASALALAHQWWQLQPQQQPTIDALIPVPLHRAKARQRGFNQAQWLASHWSKQAGVPVWSGLIKQRPTPPLEGLNRAQRRQTLKGAFSLLTPPPRRVAIIDDVLTTGATAAEMTRSLQRAGAHHVELWTLARTPLGNR
ncbi:ComF family protein [Saccharospirillum impatiens]|uniref:ComF family protein n=1 Tax=Saccharospirillum impatiens TaxID=169438 RepID=UPI00040621BC|nr:ComF family protein [Saccharospirillum impatiens]